MTPEELQRCLEEAFGDLEPPFYEELGSFYPVEMEFKDAVRTDTARTKRWQELRPLMQYLGSSEDIILLTPKACRYYLPAYLYAMTDPEVIWCYLRSVLGTIWYEDEYGHVLYDRNKWEELAALLTDRQKRCISHWLVEVLRRIDDPSVEVSAEEDSARDRIENMLEKYWKAWL
jgi:hypothetical protein